MRLPMSLEDSLAQGLSFASLLTSIAQLCPESGTQCAQNQTLGKPANVGVGSQYRSLALKTPCGRNTSSQNKENSSASTNSWAVTHLGPTCTHLGGPPLEVHCLPSGHPGTGPWSVGSDGRQVWHTSPVSSGPWLGFWQPAHSPPR